MTMPLQIPILPVVHSFTGAGYEAMIHVPDPDAGLLHNVVAEYASRLGHSFLPPEIKDARLGAVHFRGFGDGEYRKNLEEWLFSKYGWRPLPRPLRTQAAFQNKSIKDFVDDTERVFAVLQASGWTFTKRDYRIGGGLEKSGTPVTDFTADTGDGRVLLKLYWQASWQCLNPPVSTPNWVRSGGSPGNPGFVQSRFSTLELSAELFLQEDRYRLEGHDVLREGMIRLLKPLAEGKGTIALQTPGESSSEPDWPHCDLEFKLR